MTRRAGRRRTLGPVAAVATALALLATAGSASAAVIADECGAWSARNTAVTANTALPDTSAVYWTTKFNYERGLKIIITGDYLTARYMSFNVYDEGRGSFTFPDAAGGADIGSSLPDFAIQPQAGGVNPWLEVPDPGEGRRFEVVLEEQPSRARPNSMPIVPLVRNTAAPEYVILRAYRLGGRVTLPSVSYQIGSDPPVPVDTCASPGGNPDDPPANPGRCGRAGCTQAVRFSRLSSALTNTQFPNADTAYVAGRVTPPRGRKVVVIGAKAPTSPLGREPTPPWPDPDFQLRYWSMCNNVLRAPFPAVVNPRGGGTFSLGCRADEDTNLRRGEYAYVVARENQRRAVTRLRRRWPQLTFLPFSTRYARVPHLLLLRNMLPRDDFAESVMQVDPGSTPAETEAVMGDYYPEGGVCSIRRLQRRGPRACIP